VSPEAARREAEAQQILA